MKSFCRPTPLIGLHSKSDCMNRSSFRIPQWTAEIPMKTTLTGLQHGSAEVKTNGEQWIYTRPDFSKIPELYGYGVRKILLHIPCHQGMENIPTVYAPEMRFCSFGSTWNNKIGQTALPISPTAGNGYLTIDVSDIFMNSVEGWIRYTEGLILKPQGMQCDPCLLSTADSYAYPQILEIRYED